MINHQNFARAHIGDLTNKGDSHTHELLEMSHSLTTESKALRELINAATDYLNELRESGETNMFGASSYLEQEFDLEKHEAREILTVWITTFA